MVPDSKEGDVVARLAWERSITRHETVLRLLELFVILWVELQHPGEVLLRPLHPVLRLVYDDPHGQTVCQERRLTADCSSPASAEWDTGPLLQTGAGQGRFKHNQYWGTHGSLHSSTAQLGPAPAPTQLGLDNYC